MVVGYFTFTRTGDDQGPMPDGVTPPRGTCSAYRVWPGPGELLRRGGDLPALTHLPLFKT